MLLCPTYRKVEKQLKGILQKANDKLIHSILVNSGIEDLVLINRFANVNYKTAQGFYFYYHHLFNNQFNLFFIAKVQFWNRKTRLSVQLFRKTRGLPQGIIKRNIQGVFFLVLFNLTSGSYSMSDFVDRPYQYSFGREVKFNPFTDQMNAT